MSLREQLKDIERKLRYLLSRDSKSNTGNNFVEIDVVESQSNTLLFDKDYLHGKVTPLTGDLVFDFTGAKPMKSVVMTHNDVTKPSFSLPNTDPFVPTRVSQNNYYPTIDNYIVFTYLRDDLVWVNYMQGVFIEEGNSIPVASNLSISGIFVEGNVITANYTYFDNENDLELNSVLVWYRADVGGGNEVIIKTSDENDKNYTLTNADAGSIIRFSIEPKAGSGSINGNVVFSPYTVEIQSFFVENVIWKDASANLIVDGNTITSNSGINESAISTKAYSDVVENYVEFTYDNGGTRYIGLSTDANSSNSNTDIEWKLRINGDGNAGIATDPVTGDTVYLGDNFVAGNIYRITITAGVVEFVKSSDNRLTWQNIHTFDTSITASVGTPIYIDTSITTLGADLKNVVHGSSIALVNNPN